MLLVFDISFKSFLLLSINDCVLLLKIFLLLFLFEIINISLSLSSSFNYKVLLFIVLLKFALSNKFVLLFKRFSKDILNVFLNDISL